MLSLFRPNLLMRTVHQDPKEVVLAAILAGVVAAALVILILSALTESG